MSFKTASAILRGRWLIDKTFVESNLPLIFQLANGQGNAFAEEHDEQGSANSKNPVKIETKAGSVFNVRPTTDLSKLPGGAIAKFTVAGPMLKYGDMCSYGMVEYSNIINRLANSPNVAGVIIDVDSPGGQADGTAMFSDSINRLRQRKPVISYVDDGLAASAGYWILSTADEIYVSQATDMVGSVGVYTTIADWYAHYEQHYKLKVKDVYAPQSTDKNKDYYDAIAGNEEPMKEDLAVLANQFINTVKRNRGANIKKEDWTTGKMFYAKDAMKQGLIDGIKTFDQVVKRMNELIN